MWWPEKSDCFRRVLRLAVAMAAAGLTAGCFQPLYGDHSLAGGSAIRDKMSSVEVVPVDAPAGTPVARIGVETRNQLIYELTGGGGTNSPTHRLKLALSPNRLSVIVDLTSARPDVENYGIDATYVLTEIASGKTVVEGRAVARVSYDIPGSQQRFARARGLRDAENRASKVIAESIKQRLASYFVAGS
jgi:LPS-assembly lipoprotein